MAYLVLAFFGGLLTIASPCVLPVIPFLFAGNQRSFVRGALPLLLGMLVMFVAVAALAGASGAVIAANVYGRFFALLLFGLFGITLCLPKFAERVFRPLAHFGNTLSKQNRDRADIGQTFLFGMATGLLWTPCAGPILGIILTGAALSHNHFWSVALLTSYALGAVTALSAVLVFGNKLVQRLRATFGFEESLRKVVGVCIVLGTLAIATGFDQRVLTQISAGRTSGIETRLIGAIVPSKPRPAPSVAGVELGDEGKLPAIPATDTWVNTAPLTAADLRGHVVLYDFWTYSCINCLRTLPYVEQWAKQYAGDGLIVIGVHTPEFPFEKDRANVRDAVSRFHISYPVALDNDYIVWNAFGNQYWPAHYLVDQNGVIRYHHFGEGEYAQTETAIRTLLAQQTAALPPRITPQLQGVEAAADFSDLVTPETYLGATRRENYVEHANSLALNQWTTRGKWMTEPQRLVLREAGGEIQLHFHARDAHVVLGNSGSPVPFQVLLDGHAPGAAAGPDVGSRGTALVSGERLYGVIRQRGLVRDHILTLRFSKPGVYAYSFTFG